MKQSGGIRFFELIMFVALAAVFTESPEAAPLGGRNMHAPHLPWFSFPADTASPLEGEPLRLRAGLYYMNEFSAYPFNPEDYEPLGSDGRLESTDQDALTAMDFESAILELGVDWQFQPRWRVSVDWRLHARYGGFLDPVIEWWHDTLGAANAGREYFDRNRSYWNIAYESGPAAGGSGAAVASGDIDVRFIWSFLSLPRLSMGAGGAFKIPAGNTEGGFSSGSPDIAFEILTDWTPWPRWSFYADTGIVVPLGGEGRVMVQAIPAVEFRASASLSVLIQMNLQSSPLPGAEQYVHPLFGETAMFSLPQTNLKIGLKGKTGRFGWEVYAEEDPLTWEGADILLYFGASWDIRS
jgi:hypothetical protein